MKLGMKIAIVFGLALLIIGIVGVQSYLGIQRLTESSRWVIHTHEVLEKLEHVLSVLKDAETGQRGFVLTGEDRYLETYNTATGEIQSDIDAVASLTQDNPEQQKSLQQLRNLTRDRLDELQETIKLRRKAGMGAALTVIRSDHGKRIMDEIRKLVAQMERREGELLEVRNRAAGEIARRSTLTVGFGVLLSLAFLGIAAVIVTGTMRLADRNPGSKDSGRKWIRIALRYTFAVVAVVLAVGLRWWLVRSFGPMPLFITIYPVVLLVATAAGGGPGVVATFLSALTTDYLFIEPIGQFGIAATNDAVSAGIFTGTGIFLSVLAERLQRSRRAEAISVTQEKELALLNKGNLMALDLDHRIVRWSEGNHRLYGFDSQEAQGQVTNELLQTNFGQPLEQIHSELTKKNYWEGEVTRRTKDGTQLSVALLWALRRDDHGMPLAILEASTDITRQKLAEESLRQQSEELAQQNEELSQQSEELTQQAEELSKQNEELQTQSEEIQTLNAELGQREKTLQTLLESSRLPIGEHEMMEKICRAALEMMGQPATGVVLCEQHGDELKILAHAGFDGDGIPGAWPLTGSFVEVVIQENRTASLEDTSLRPDLNILSVPGHQRFGAVLSSPLRVKGKPIGAVSIYSSKTQQWTAEQFRLIEWLAAQCSNTLEAMRLAAEVLQGQKQNEFLANILEASSQAFGVGYPDGRLGMTNKAFEQIAGYSSEELRSIDWAKKLTPPEWLEIERRKLDELQRTGLPVRYEKEYIRKDGTHVPIELLVHVEKDAEGKPLYYYSFLTDITERKKAEEQIRALNGQLKRQVAELDAANKELEAFIYSVSHDLRAPLRFISGFSKIVYEDYSDRLDAQGRDYLARIKNGSDRMSQLIEDLLRLSRISRQDIERVDYDLSSLASAVVNSIRDAAPARNVEIVIAEGLRALVDPNLMKIALTNLFDNAWKFTSKTENARVEFGATEKGSKTVYFVKDNGAGLDPTYAEKMFLPFHRLHSEKEFEGTGIGLAIVDRIIRRHEGSVCAEGEVGKGAAIYFTLG